MGAAVYVPSCVPYDSDRDRDEYNFALYVKKLSFDIIT